MRVVVSGAARPQRAMRFPGRSLAPRPSITDTHRYRHPTGHLGKRVRRPVGLDLSSVTLSDAGITRFFSELSLESVSPRSLSISARIREL